MPELPTTFFNSERMADFWGMVKWFLGYNMPIIMMVCAVPVVYYLLSMIIDIFVEAKLAREGRSRGDYDDDDDDDD